MKDAITIILTIGCVLLLIMFLIRLTYEMFEGWIRKKYEREYKIQHSGWCIVWEKRYGVLIDNIIIHYDYNNCPLKANKQIIYSDKMYSMKRYYQPFHKL